MGFQPFEDKRVKRTEPAVSITRFGNFTLNAACVRELFRGYKYIKVYWDAKQRKVGLKPLKRPDEFSYSVNVNSKGSIGTFSGTAFIKAMGIDYSETRAYLVSWNEEEKLIEFSVGEHLVKKEAGRE